MTIHVQYFSLNLHAENTVDIKDLLSRDSLIRIIFFIYCVEAKKIKLFQHLDPFFVTNFI